MDTNHLDAYAKQQGFPDFETMKAWHNHRAQALQHPMDYTINGQPASASPDQQNQQPLTAGNWLQMLMHDPLQAFARIMPQSSSLMRVNDAFTKAGQ